MHIFECRPQPRTGVNKIESLSFGTSRSWNGRVGSLQDLTHEQQHRRQTQLHHTQSESKKVIFQSTLSGGVDFTLPLKIDLTARLPPVGTSASGDITS